MSPDQGQIEMTTLPPPGVDRCRRILHHFLFRLAGVTPLNTSKCEANLQVYTYSITVFDSTKIAKQIIRFIIICLGYDSERIVTGCRFFIFFIFYF